ncbi:MAG: beta-lactamase family protein [Actinobacteria bacterium]|nr:beta-lactamase family protein [Actinomycetota bacterium]
MEILAQSVGGARFFLRLAAKAFAAALIALCLSAASTGAAPHSAREPSVDAAAAKRIVGAVTRELKRGALPGAIVGVARDGHRPWVFARGYADLRTRRPMRTDEHVRIGSVTKAFVTTLLLRLAQEGKLGLDQPIDRYVAGIPGYTAISWYLPQEHLALAVSVNSDIHVGRSLPNFAYEPASETGHLVTRVLPPGHVAPAAVKVRGAAPDAPLHRPVPKILSASWGTDGAVGCPNGAQGLDNIPVTFNWFIRRRSIQPRDFRIVRSDGTTATPTCALQFPPDERDEAQTVNLIGDFGDSVNGPTPVAIKVVGTLEGKSPGAHRWRPIGHLKKVSVDPLAGGPYIVDAWTLMPSIYRNDPNRCQVGETFVRVMWSNGLNAYPTGEEVGAPVTASYRAIYRLADGATMSIAPLEVADLHDHETSFNADNMHDLCLPAVPRGARLAGVTIAANLIQDPNGDPNLAQDFRLRE